MNTRSQNDVLLAALKRGPITVYNAMFKLGIGCPTKRIHELRARHNIKTIRTKVKTRWGKSVIATYVLG
jgi:hypothetical protein